MLNRIEEAALIARCMAFDDRRAFGKIVDAYNPGLRRFLLHLSGNRDIADDLAQETFIKAYQGIRNFKGLSKFKTWLYRIAYREFYSYVRAEHPTENLDDVTDAPVAEKHDEQIDANHDVEVALRMIPPVERSLVLLFYMEDRPIKEITEITGLPAGTVKSYLSRARNRMKKALSDDKAQY